MIEYEGETYLTVDEAAQAAGISVAYFRLLRKRCAIRAYYFPKWGNRQFFRKSDIGAIFKPKYKLNNDRNGQR